MTETALAGGVGLRERKRRATSRTIQFAVLELAVERGLDQVTVEEISRVANISPRTFFNYFPSKEAAMVGDNPLELPPGLIDSFVDGRAGADLVDGLLDLMQHIALIATGDRELHQLRRQVLRSYPELFIIKVAGMHSFETVLAEAVERRLDAESVGQDAIGSRLAQARLTALVAIAALRHAVTSWAEGADDESLSEKLTESFSLLRRVL